jgi:hypothetical protein
MLNLKQPSPWMTIIPIALVSAGIGFALLQNRSGLPETYRYKYEQSLEHRAQTRTQAFVREIAFLQERVNRNPNDGLDLAGLAGAYIAKARVSGQNAWYVLAEQAAERSLAALPLEIGNTGAQLALAEIAQAQHDFSRALTLIDSVTEERIGARIAVQHQTRARRSRGSTARCRTARQGVTKSGEPELASRDSRNARQTRGGQKRLRTRTRD